jgi:hypothetical protein
MRPELTRAGRCRLWCEAALVAHRSIGASGAVEQFSHALDIGCSGRAGTDILGRHARS